MAKLPQAVTGFKALTFDCYGTLIDWETGIRAGLQPIISNLPPDHRYLKDESAIISRFNSFQGPLELEQPTLPYNEVLAYCYDKIAQEEGIKTALGESEKFGRSVGDWPAFPDTVKGLLELKKHYKLIILSNVDRENVLNTLQGPLGGVQFDAVYTAQDIGSYKPSHKNFEYLFRHVKEEFGIEKSQILHTAKSLPVDHVPAKELGLTSAWIARGVDGLSAMGGDLAVLKEKVAFTWRFSSIGLMAEYVQQAFGDL